MHARHAPAACLLQHAAYPMKASEHYSNTRQLTVQHSCEQHSHVLNWCCCALRVSEDVLFAMHDCALGISPVTSYSGVKKSFCTQLACAFGGFPLHVPIRMERVLLNPMSRHRTVAAPPYLQSCSHWSKRAYEHGWATAQCCFLGLTPKKYMNKTNMICSMYRGAISHLCP